MGYKVGGPLIQPAFDNEKGLFELLPIVLQNDEFMAKQHIGWSYNVINYDSAENFVIVVKIPYSILKVSLTNSLNVFRTKPALTILSSHCMLLFTPIPVIKVISWKSCLLLVTILQ
jgi:hypothetical protein